MLAEVSAENNGDCFYTQCTYLLAMVHRVNRILHRDENLTHVTLKFQ